MQRREAIESCRMLFRSITKGNTVITGRRLAFLSSYPCLCIAIVRVSRSISVKFFAGKSMPSNVFEKEIIS